MSDTGNGITIKLLVDKERNKVLFAECDKDFVDVLFSFLTLPLGTVVRLLNKQSQLGSMDALYQSVEKLDTEYFETEACKSMLLRPRSVAQKLYQNLVLNVDDATEDNLIHYICPTWTCTTRTHCLVSMFPNATCLCGNIMNQVINLEKEMNGDKDKLEGVFVKGIGKFMIGDDLKVSAVSIETSFSMFVDFGIKDGSAVEEKEVSVGMKEVLFLLKRSLVSTTAMTDVFLSNSKQIILRKIKMEPMDVKPTSTESQCDVKKISLKLVIRRSTKKVLYAASSGDFLDLLVGFLPFSVAAVSKLCENFSYMCSMDTLYMSVVDLCNSYPENFQSSKKFLHKYQQVFHHGSKNDALQIKERRFSIHVSKCKVCSPAVCVHGLGKATLRVINPKCKETDTESGKGFVNESAMFMITDELVVEPLSPLSSMSFVNKQGVLFSDLEERSVKVGKQEALSILNASLTSNTVLTDVFCQNK